MDDTSKTKEFYWVGIGASAGGLEALQDLCKALPDNTNMIYIVAQHLSPKHKSMLPDLIQRNTSLKVESVRSGIVAKPNTIYVTPPQHDVHVEGSKIFLTKTDDNVHPKPDINDLFLSLAETKKDHAVGVILSGTGSDGAHGIKSIRASGGLTIVQDEKTAKYDGMPRSAIDTDCVDFILSPTDIGTHLERLSSRSPRRANIAQDNELEDSFGDLIELVKKHCGISFKDYKKATLQRRIERRMLACGIDDIENYVAYAKENEKEVHLLYKDIIISVTDFFRDKKPFEELKKAFENIVDENHQGPIRIWTVGCATGEEAYSLGIILAEHLGGIEKLAEKNIQIFATDIDSEALSVARRGIYPKASMANVPPEIEQKYFIQNDDKYEVIKPLREIILFAKHNIIEDPPFLRMNLITCRNLLIYFEPQLQNKIYNVFHYALQKNGHLFLGKSESTTQVSTLFRPVASSEKIYQKRNDVAKPPHRFTMKGRKTEDDVEVFEKSASKNNKQSHLYENLVKQLGDVSILINDNFNIEHIYGDATPYITIANSKPNWNLADIINDVHRQELRALVFKALRSEKIAQGQIRKIKIDGKIYRDRLNVYPLQTDKDLERLALVTFENLGKLKKSKNTQSTYSENNDERMRELEDELAAAREHLQTVIEELETSNEELQSMNEELQSSNEELQSSNEELETTNEELQSANEELITMNDEMNNKTIALEQTTNHLTNVKNSLDFPLVVIDDKNRVLRSNEAARDFFDIEKDNEMVKAILPDSFDAKDIAGLIKDVKKSAQPQNMQLENKDRFYWLHVTPYRQQNGVVEGAILSFIDNTDLVRQKQALLESRKKAQEANRAKSEFLANMSHEIRTPLNAICGVNEMLKKTIDDPERRDKLFDVMNSSASNLKELIDDILDFAKLEAGQLRLEQTNFSLKDMLSKVKDIYSLQANDKNIDLRASVADGMPDNFYADSLRIYQILANITSNAVKFTHEGVISINVTGQKKDDQNHLTFVIEDSGIGMNANEIEAIFDKFAQSDASISRRYGGTGLGLAIVKELVDLMNGTINVESEKGTGTTFTITLPVETVQSNEEKIDNSEDHDKKLVGSPDVANKNPILLIEDNESNIFILSSFLDELGCVYDIARNGYEGLDFVNNGTYYPVILLDLQMDGMNGFDFFEKLKEIQANENLKKSNVIALTAHVEKEIINRCKNAGMADFISKPLELGKLEQVLHQYFD